MKKIIYLTLIVAALFGCIPQYRLTVNAFDLSKYTKQGVVVTTSTIGVPYESISIVSAEGNSGKHGKGKIKLTAAPKEKYKGDPVYYDPVDENDPNVRYGRNVKMCTYDDLIEAMVAQSKALGANAIIELEMQITYQKYGPTIRSASGLAIKIK